MSQCIEKRLVKPYANSIVRYIPKFKIAVPITLHIFRDLQITCGQFEK